MELQQDQAAPAARRPSGTADAGPREIFKGEPYPLGAVCKQEGVNFALFSEHATGVELCLFDELGQPESRRIRFTERQNHVWHALVPGLKAGQLYGYRVEGPFEPAAGHRFNPNKVLLDPYAKAIAGDVKWDDALFGYRIGAPDADLSFDDRDDAPLVPKSVVVDDAFDWGEDIRPRRPLHETIVYETHVRGFTQRRGSIPVKLRGSYAALGSKDSIEYLRQLGVNAIELMPVQQFVHSRHLLDAGRRDYWGYNTIGFFAPHNEYSSRGDRGEQVTEFKQMVHNLHLAGFEVYLDVVYNHTAEGSHLGPTLSFRGIDNRSYYRLVNDDPRYCMDYTGTGNTLNVPEPRVLQLLMDSLRYWVTEMHVDGFRFDLAAALARELHEVRKLGAFFDVIHQDPVISQVKLIAEPWDLGEGGYQVGNFPVLWAEWNGRYRDTIRRYWKGDSGLMRDLAYRLCGSADLYEHSGRTPAASINFVTAHDGFSLRDLWSFNEPHNEANGEDNRDGDRNNNSWNCGHEGLDAPDDVRALRRRMQRNLLATLLLSQGVPMVRSGDERNATQGGNNNAYCQDNEVSWLDWSDDPEAAQLFEFTRRLVDLRNQHVIFRQPRFFQGRDLHGNGIKDLTWYNADGAEMNDEAWGADFAKVMGVMFCGDSLDVRGEDGAVLRDDTFLLYTNSHHEDVTITLPSEAEVVWSVVLDTAQEPAFPREPLRLNGGASHLLPARSLVLLVQAAGSDEAARHAHAPRRKKRS